MAAKRPQKWVQGANLKRGALHQRMGYRDDEKIPPGEIAEIRAAEVGDTVNTGRKTIVVNAHDKRMANTAKTLGKMRKGKK